MILLIRNDVRTRLALLDKYDSPVSITRIPFTTFQRDSYPVTHFAMIPACAHQRSIFQDDMEWERQHTKRMRGTTVEENLDNLIFEKRTDVKQRYNRADKATEQLEG
ncbi:hypothetical protein CAEBREN_14723 [Caenorhabditis brenneri]|uniref:Uncharacterized protein n=1 Tax=Caenorhabditis brenneri TaxID=135651 RepID=G0NXC7_CAEBE|nr:hypothetical protein CAEBREN_14723 [Caenorhabditis brenneri]